MLALAILTVIAASASRASTDIITLTVPEARRLINALMAAQTPTLTQVLHWSMWRRRHQAQAKASHHKRRSQIEAELTA
jgi:hypothetical protein